MISCFKRIADTLSFFDKVQTQKKREEQIKEVNKSREERKKIVTENLGYPISIY